MVAPSNPGATGLGIGAIPESGGKVVSVPLSRLLAGEGWGEGAMEASRRGAALAVAVATADAAADERYALA